MTSNIIHPGKPGHINAPQIEREEGSTLGSAERERKHTVDASRLAFIAVALMMSSLLFAQTAPSTPTPQTPTTTPRPVTQQPHSTQPQGWTMFDSNVGTRLKLQGDQLERLQGVDDRYKERYTGLGEMPWKNAGYAPLTQERNDNIKTILTPTQYDQWMTTYSGQGPDKAPRKPAGMKGTTTPPTGQH